MEEGRKGIGALLERLRTEQGCTMEQLGRGICTPSQIEKIEKEQLAKELERQIKKEQGYR